METYDSLLESDPVFQQKLALVREQERIKVLSELTQAFHEIIIEITRIRFPDLVELTQQRVTAIQKLEDLKQLYMRLATAPNQKAVRRILLESAED